MDENLFMQWNGKLRIYTNNTPVVNQYLKLIKNESKLENKGIPAFILVDSNDNKISDDMVFVDLRNLGIVSSKMDFENTLFFPDFKIGICIK